MGNRLKLRNSVFVGGLSSYRRLTMLVLFIGLGFPLWAFGGMESYAVKGAKIYTVEDGVYDPGVLVVKEGRVHKVGPETDVTIPQGIAVKELSGKVIIPGLVDSHSHVGVISRPIVEANIDGNEATGPIQPDVRAIDAVNPSDPGVRMAVAGGVTAANIMPGSANAIGGETIYVKFRGNSVEEMRVESEEVVGGIKMANGENPKRAYGDQGKAPDTRMKIAALQRQAFHDARHYQDQWDRYRERLAQGKDVSPPEIDLEAEPLVEVLEGQRTVHFHTHRADDILSALRLKEAFGFDLVIQHGTEAYKVADQIAAHDVPVSMTLVDSPGGKAEIVDFSLKAPRRLAEAGVKVLINTDDPITSSRFLLRTAALAIREGLPPKEALKAITLYPAEAMRLDDRIGSLKKGKDADFVVLSGEPFDLTTRVLRTFIDGQEVFDLRDGKDRRYQTGGFSLSDPSEVPEIPLVEETWAEGEDRLSAEQTPLEGEDADEERLAVRADYVHTVANGTIRDGVVVIRDHTIKHVGRQDEVDTKGIPVLEATAVTPGLIDAYTVVPLNGQYNVPADQEANELSGPNQADVRALDAFNPFEPLLDFLLSQGITVVHSSPGRGNVIGGTTGVFQTFGSTLDEMTIEFPYGMMFSLGDRPKGSYEGQKPETRMGTAALIREALTKTLNYGRKKEKAEEPVAKKLKLEALSKVLDGEIRAIFAAQRAHDLTTALRLVKEYDLEGRLALAGEGYLIPERIGSSEIPVIVHPTMQRVGGLDTLNTFLGNAGVLADQGVSIAIGSGEERYVPKTRVVRYEAAMAATYGLGFERALEAVTLEAAKILGIQGRFGSLEPGKQADLVLFDGNPFEHTTRVTQVLVKGEMAYDRDARGPDRE